MRCRLRGMSLASLVHPSLCKLSAQHPPVNHPIAHFPIRRRTLVQGIASALVAPGLTACGGPSSGSSSDASSGGPSAPPAARTFTHPGLLHTEADLERARARIAAGTQPWVNGWGALANSGRSNLNTSPRPLETVIRGGDGQNFAQMYIDMQRAHQLALRWKISGDVAYADKAVEFLNAWSSTMRTLTGNADRFLAAGIYGYQWANAAELMRSYPGWAQADVARFQALLLNVFYPLCHHFLVDHNGTEHTRITNYWANWDLCALCGIYAIGVFCDRPDLTDEAVSYYKTGRGNGAAAHNVYVLHPGHLGQWQESHRDQGHATLGIALAGMLCEMAWSQGEDLYGYWNNRLLAGAEYVAQSNLVDGNGALYTLPFSTYSNSHGTGTGVSPAGRPHLRPCWELIYNHYVNRLGLAAPWTTAMAEKMRTEGTDFGGDQPGLGTLLYTREPAAAARPSGLSAYLSNGQVLLSWWGSADATHYLVQRAGSPNGPFATIAQVSEPRTYTDAPPKGIWYYRISAVTPVGERSGTETPRVAVPGELWLHLPLSGHTNDVSGHGRHGRLVGGTSWVEGRTGGSAVRLDGSSGHVVLPDGALSALGDFTIALWAYWETAATNTRVFDFGSSDIAYMALSPRDNRNQMRFMATRTHWYGEQALSTSTLPTGRWVHLAVTLSGTVGTLYVDGSPIASHSEIQLPPCQFGHTRSTWLGRSQYGADPFFNGRLQDLRIYSGALDASSIADLAR